MVNRRRTALGLVVAISGLVLAAGVVLAFNGYLSIWADIYPDSTLDTTLSCNICHCCGPGSERNSYGADVEANLGLGTANAIRAVEGIDSDEDGFTNIEEIDADTAPGDPDSHPTVNEPPTCDITHSPPAPTTDDLVTFDSGAADADGTIASVDWDFSDGGTASGDPAGHQYAAAGSYTVTATVTDNEGATGSCTHAITIGVATVAVSIPLTDTGWQMISLPLEPVDKNVLLDRATDLVDEGSIFYDSYSVGNDPRNRLFRIEPGVGYWTYEPSLYPDQSWYEIGVEPPAGKPDPGPWWQGFWLLVDVPHTLTYTAYPLPATGEVRFVDITSSPGGWAWMMMGACARVPDPYNPDVGTWPATSTATDLAWGKSTPPVEPTEWWPTAACPVAAANDAWDRGYIGLALSGFHSGVGYYTVSPDQLDYCGTPANTEYLTPGEGYWLDVEDPEVWLGVLAGQWQ